jgi:hypothetical protein
MKMYEIGYYFESDGKRLWRQEQVTDTRLARIQKRVAEKKDYVGFRIIADLGEKDTTWLDTWEKIGLANLWIKEAYDPPFNKDMIVECKTLDYLIQMFEHGNWSLGTGFYYKDLCFINQDDGGDEYLTIRRGVSFESISCRSILQRRGTEYFKRMVNAYLAATDEQLNCLDYYRDQISKYEVATKRLSLSQLQQLPAKESSDEYGSLKLEELDINIYLKPLSHDEENEPYAHLATVTRLDSDVSGKVMIDQYIAR